MLTYSKAVRNLDIFLRRITIRPMRACVGAIIGGVVGGVTGAFTGHYLYDNKVAPEVRVKFAGEKFRE